MNFRLKKENRIRSRKDIVLLLRKGKKLEREDFKVFLKEREDFSRIGISVKKGLVNSVKRNRIRRLFKEAFRKNKRKFKKPLDLFIIVKKDLSERSYFEVEKAFLNVLEKEKFLQ